MPLARIKTWNPGDTLTAADLNAEFNNPLNNPISLVSPTTGAINFQTSIAHTNLAISALTASSAPASAFLVTSTAATPLVGWSSGASAGGVLMASTGAVPTWLAIGTAGQLLIAASSGAPAYSTGVNFVTTSKHLVAQRFVNTGQGTALTSNNFSLSSGWGSTAVIQSIRGFDQAYTLTVLTGSTVSGNPTVTCTFADGSWQAVPVGVVTLAGGNGILTAQTVQWSAFNTSGQTFQPLFTPTTGVTYTYMVVNFG